MRFKYCIWNTGSCDCWICNEFYLFFVSRNDITNCQVYDVFTAFSQRFIIAKSIKSVSLKVIISIFTHDIRLKLFWYNLFKSYQLSKRKCEIFSRVMVAIFAPFSYPFFDIVSLVKYTQQKLQLNAFIANEKDLGRFKVFSDPIFCP